MTFIWNFIEAVALVRKLEPIAIQHGVHVALGGSVLHAGFSSKDLDIFVYPHKKTEAEQKPWDPVAILKAFGATDISVVDYHPDDGKLVYCTKDATGRRIDFFFVK